MKLMILIVPRNESEQVAKIISDKKIDFQTTVPAHGTAPTEILEYLSLGDVEMDLLFSVIDDHDVLDIFKKLDEELGFLNSGHGVAFTVEIDALTKLGYQYLYHQLETQEEK
ncbi:MAG: hypothetical protein PHZ28_03935 [Candidatus Izemoplasmatales bacterium]|nr:hypothetical protein [Candidatus Izemoplasmatales bacterium]